MSEGTEREVRPATEPPFPRAVRIAGIVWIVFGCLMLINAVLNLLLTAALVASGEGKAAGGACAPWIGALFGAAFIYVGLQSMRGTATDTIGNGIGSIVFGLLNGGIGAVLILGATGLAILGKAAIGGPAALIIGIFGGVELLAGGGLLAAGVLALAGRKEYKAWRKAQKLRVGEAGMSQRSDERTL